MDDMRADPVLCYTRVSEHLSDVKWLNDSTILGATGRGNLKLFKFNEEARTVKHIGQSTLSIRCKRSQTLSSRAIADCALLLICL